MIGIVTLQFSSTEKWKRVTLLSISAIPIVATCIFKYVLNNVSADSIYPTVGLCVWSLVIASYVTPIAALFLNKNAKHKKLIFMLCFIVLVAINLPVYEGHEGWGYHGHAVFGLFLHVH